MTGLVASFAAPRLDAIHTLLRFSEGGVGEDGVLEEGMRWLRDEPRTHFSRVLIAAPDGTGPHPTLVFIHGVALKGLDDARVIRAIDAFRDAGFLVVAPQVRVLVSPPENDRDLSRTARLIRVVAEGRIDGVDTRRIGVMGVSVGGGLALRAVAAYRQIGGSQVRAVLAIGAPDDLRETIRTWFRTPRPDLTAPASTQRWRREEARFARNVVYRAALGRRVPNERDARLIRRWLEHNLDPHFSPDGLHTEAGRSMVALIGGTPAEWTPALPALIEDAWPLMKVFSPAAAEGDPAGLHQLSGVACFLLHGTGDPLVPIDELDRLAGRLRAHTMVATLASRMIAHVDVEEVGIGEQAEHIVFMDDFFDMVRR